MLLHAALLMNDNVPRRMFVSQLAVGLVLGTIGCASKKDKQETEMPSAEVGGLFRKFEKRIKKVVPDKSRAKSAKAELDAIEAKIFEVDGHFRDMRSKFAQLPQEQRDSMEDCAPITQATTEKMVVTLKEACQNAVNLRQHITEAEWPKIFPGEAV